MDCFRILNGQDVRIFNDTEKNGYELYFGKAFENVINYINGNPTNISNPEVV